MNTSKRDALAGSAPDRSVGHAGSSASPATSIGASLFALWGVLHLWVGCEGLHQYLVSPARGLWGMFLGGANAPSEAFAFPVDRVTVNAQAHIVLNFCFDVAGYGLLGIAIAWLIHRQSSWTAYLMGAVLIGVCDLSFLFLQVTSGIIALNLPSLSGPVLWFLAVCITPFGLDSKRRDRIPLHAAKREQTTPAHRRKVPRT